MKGYILPNDHNYYNYVPINKQIYVIYKYMFMYIYIYIYIYIYKNSKAALAWRLLHTEWWWVLFC